MKTFSGKLLIILALVLIGATTVQAQFFYGAKGGYLSSKVTGDTYGGINWAGSPSGGLSFGFKLGRTDWNLQWDVLYSGKGTKQKFIVKDYIDGYLNDSTPTYSTVTKQYDNQLKLSYVEVPLFIKKSFSFKGGIFPYERTISKVDFDICFGPYVAFMFGSSADLSATRQETVDENGEITVGATTDTVSSFFMGQHASASIDVQYAGQTTFPEETLLAIMEGEHQPEISGLNKLDVGINVGIGFSIELSNSSKLTFEARTAIGMLSIDKTYFNDYHYTFTEVDPQPTTEEEQAKYTDVGSIYYTTKKTTTAVDLKNYGIGFYVGFIKYVGAIRQ